MTSWETTKLIQNILKEECQKYNIEISYIVCSRFKYFSRCLINGDVKLDKYLTIPGIARFQKMLAGVKEEYENLKIEGGSYDTDRIIIFVDTFFSKCINPKNHNVFMTTYHEIEHAKQERVVINNDYNNPNYLKYLIEMAIPRASFKVYMNLYQKLFFEIEAERQECIKAFNFLKNNNMLQSNQQKKIFITFLNANHLIYHYDFMNIFREYLMLCKDNKIKFDFKTNPLSIFIDKNFNFKKFDELDFEKVLHLKRKYNNDILDILTSDDMFNSMKKDSPNISLMSSFIKEEIQLEANNYQKDLTEYYDRLPNRKKQAKEQQVIKKQTNNINRLIQNINKIYDNIEKEQGVVDDRGNSFNR